MKDFTFPNIEGFLKIKDIDSGEILLDKKNAIHAENFSITAAKALSSDPEGSIHEMYFGNGGSTVSGSGAITYFPPNVIGPSANLYNATYYKVINDKSPLNSNPLKNKIQYSHVTGFLFTDIIITCTLDYNEPSGQAAFDDITTTEAEFVFDEIGLKSFNLEPQAGLLLTHVIFNPIQKSLNRSFEIVYTIRLQYN